MAILPGPFEDLFPDPGSVASGASPGKLYVQRLWGAIRSAIIKPLLKYADTNFADLPDELKNLETHLELLLGLRKLLPASELAELNQRIDAVENSLKDLFKVIGDPSAPGSLLFAKSITHVAAMLRGILDSTKQPKDVVVDLIRDVLAPDELLQELFTAATDPTRTSFWQPIVRVPRSLTSGKLHGWVYATSYPFHPETLYRKRLLGDLDGFFRRYHTGRYATADEFSGFDETVRTDNCKSVLLMTNVIEVVLTTTMKFIFEKTSYPQLEFDWSTPEDLSAHFASSFAMQVRASSRASIGTLLRGAWQFTVDSENLIESVGSIVSTFVSATVEAVIRRLFWSFEIVSSLQPPPTGSYLFATSVYAPAIGSTALGGSKIHYAAIGRERAGGGPSSPYPPEVHTYLNGLFVDYVTYLEVCHERARYDPAFPKVGSQDYIRVTGTRSESGREIVSLNVGQKEAAGPSWRIPVVRWYDTEGAYVLIPHGTPTTRSADYDFFRPGRGTINEGMVRTSGGAVWPSNSQTAIIIHRVCISAVETRHPETGGCDCIKVIAFQDDRSVELIKEHSIANGATVRAEKLVAGSSPIRLRLDERTGPRGHEFEVLGEASVSESGAGAQLIEGEIRGYKYRYVISWT